MNTVDVKLSKKTALAINYAGNSAIASPEHTVPERIWVIAGLNGWPIRTRLHDVRTGMMHDSSSS